MTSPNQLSFLPDDYLQRKSQRRTNAICAGLFMVVMVAVGSAFSYSDRSNRDVDQWYDVKQKEFTAEAERIKQADQMQEKQRTMQRQAELAASLLEKVPRSFVLAEITNAMPPGVSLVDFALESRPRNVAPVLPPGSNQFEQRKVADAAAKLASAIKAYDVNMRITGLAPTDVQVAAFIRKLSNSRLLRDVNMVITNEFEKDGEHLRKFQVECMLDPDAEILPTAVGKTTPGNTAAVEVQPR